VRGRELIILIAILFMVVMLGLTTNFLFVHDPSGRLEVHLEPLKVLLDNNAYAIIASVGMTMVIVSAQIDLSVGSALAVCSLAAGYGALAGVPIPLVVLLTIAVGTAIGLVNGLLVSKGGIHSIIVTLGMMTLLRGLILLVTQQEWLYPPESFKHLGRASFLGLPLPVWMAAAVVPVAAYLLINTRIGREIYAVGSNPNAASLSGINVPRIRFLTLTLNGTLIGLAALAHAPRFTAIQNNIGKGFELVVITSVVVGGTSIFGGSGTILGSLLGVLFIGLTRTAMVFFRIPAIWEQAVYGLCLLVAVAIDIVRARRRVAMGGLG